VSVTTADFSMSSTKRDVFINKASTADMVVRGAHGYASDIGDLRYLKTLGLPIGQIALRMQRSAEVVSRMLAQLE
jgi:hypothetical protein